MTTKGNVIKVKQSNSSMQHHGCVALCKYISLQRRRFCARSLASCIPRSSEDMTSWLFFIQVVRSRPGGHLQCSAAAAQTVLGIYLKRTCSRETSASSALTNDYAVYMSTLDQASVCLDISLIHPLTHWQHTLQCNALPESAAAVTCNLVAWRSG